MNTDKPDMLPIPVLPTATHEDALDEATVTRLGELGISRRRFLSLCAGMASLMALPQSMVPRLAAAATAPLKPRVVFLSLQECTGCSESMFNSFAFQGGATIENLLLNLISLDYHETLMAAAGYQAEEQLHGATSITSDGGHILIVDGSVPALAESGYFVSGGRSGVGRFLDAAKNARLIISLGTCASFGGLPKAAPNPTGAISIEDLMFDYSIKKPLINVSGCPPIPEVITGTILYFLTYGKAPPLDGLKRPVMFYGKTVHDDCVREEYFDEEGLFASSFDDANARKGACLFDLGCKGPITHNACSRIKWNQGISYPMYAGHGCIGCAEPNFWDLGNLGPNGDKKGFYVRLTKAEDFNNHGKGKTCDSCHDGGDPEGEGGGDDGRDDD